MPVPSEVAETKVCPDCAEAVKAAARICRFCRYDFRSDDEPSDSVEPAPVLASSELSAGAPCPWPDCTGIVPAKETACNVCRLPKVSPELVAEASASTCGLAAEQSAPRSTNGFATASLVLSLVLGPIGWVLSIILGHVALGQITRRRQAGRGLAIAGLTISYLALFVLLMAGVAYLTHHHSGASPNPSQPQDPFAGNAFDTGNGG